MPDEPRRYSSTTVIVALIVSALAVTTLTILLARRAPTPRVAAASEQQQWETANHDRVIAMKREAEGLVLENNLREAAAKYREIDALIGKRKIESPALATEVAAARDDARVAYQAVLKSVEDSTTAAPSSAAGAAPRSPLAPPVPPAAATTSARPPAVAPPATTPLTPAAPTPAAPSPHPTPPRAGPAPGTSASAVPPAPKTLAAPAHPAASRPAFAIVAGEVPRGEISDADIGLSIQLGVDYLLQQFEDGELVLKDAGREGMYRQGLNALCVYALATAERAIRDPRLNPRGPQMDAMLEKLKEFEFFGGEGRGNAPVTYARSLRACALATFNRPQDRDQLKDDVDWLINASTGGAYTYDDRFASKPRTRRPPRRPGSTTRPPRADAAGEGDRSLLPGRGEGWGERRAARQPDDARFSEATPGEAHPRRAPVFAAPAPGRRGGMFDDQENANPDRRTPLPRPTPPSNRGSVWDNSNSQYGLLGVWAGAEVGIEVPDNYWRLVQRHWASCQFPTGEWGYSPNTSSGYFSMTVAGIASLLVTHDYLEAPLMGGNRSFDRDPYPPALSAGLKWLERDDNAMKVESRPLFYYGYNLFGLERVALASGYKQFGRHDWFVELASDVLSGQNLDGSFSPEEDGRKRLIESAYALLFLSRGRHPVMMNKLRFEDFWTNRPREISNLANFVAKELERPINWQAVDVARSPQDWADAPVVFIASHKKPKFDDDAIDKLRRYAEDGGLIFTHADLGSAEFNAFMPELAKKLFPQYAFAELSTEHPIYTVNYSLKSPRPRLQGVSNGSRLLLVHSPTDVSSAWQGRAIVSRKEMYELGINVYLYTTGKQRFRNRLDTPVVPEPTKAPAYVLNLARVRYGQPGSTAWDPEPAAWPRFARKLQWETGVRVNVVSAEATTLIADKVAIAHVTGTAAWQPTSAEIDALRAFVSSGGTLLVDAAGGSGAFADAENAWLPQLLGSGVKLESLPPGDPLLAKSVDGTANVPPQALRLFALEQLRTDNNRLKSAKVGNGRVIFTPLDLTSGLLGTCTWGVMGYLPEYSEAAARNLVLTTAATR